MSYNNVIIAAGIEIKGGIYKPAAMIKQEKKELRIKGSKSAIEYVLKEEEIQVMTEETNDSQIIKAFSKIVVASEYENPEVLDKVQMKYNEICLKLKHANSKESLAQKLTEFLDRIREQIKMCQDDI